MDEKEAEARPVMGTIFLVLDLSMLLFFSLKGAYITDRLHTAILTSVILIGQLYKSNSSTYNKYMNTRAPYTALV